MIFSPAHQVFVHRHESAGQLASAIPGAKTLNGQWLTIPNDLFALQVSRVLGLPIPPVMDIDDYDWPCLPGRTPYSHQKYMSNFAVLHPKHANLSDMGTGKTLACLWAADYLMNKQAIKKALIISPLSTITRVWQDEIFRNMLGRRSASILYGTREKRLEALAEDRDFYIINHDGLGIGSSRSPRGLTLGPLAEEIRRRKDIGLVIVDEASAYKDGATRRTKILRQVITEKPYVWLLSGTPTPNAPTDAWSLARLIGNLGSESFTSFRLRTMSQITQFKWIPRAGSADIVQRALSPAVRFSREECIDLPECVVETRDVPLSATQQSAYNTLKKELQVTMASGQKITAINEAVLRLKLLQIVAGCVYGPDREVVKTDAAPRLSVLKEVIDEAGGKILVFAPFTSVVNMLHSELRAHYGDYAVAKVYGATSQGTRNEIFRAFEQEDQPRMIVADAACMAHGLSLTAANTIVWWVPSEKPEIYEQANARINRPGQTRKMLIVQLSSTPIEREIYKRLDEKRSLQGVVLKLAEEGR